MRRLTGNQLPHNAAIYLDKGNIVIQVLDIQVTCGTAADLLNILTELHGDFDNDK